MEAIWLSPFFTSPMADFGYDVSDYCDVDPVFGTLADFDVLVAACHARGLRVVIDWVPNHTSDRHPWFAESRAARDSAKRDWYVWRDPAPDGGAPNDWRSQFAACGAAWTLDAATGQYYLHSFMPEQPDLNWEHPEVAEAMHDTLRFWLDRGVDGFRLDAIHKIAKDPLLRDHVGAPRRHDEDWDTIHDRLRGIRRVIDAYDDRMIVGEVALQDLHRIVGYLESGDQLHLAHNFVWAELPWDADAFRTSIADFDTLADEHGLAGLVPLQPRPAARAPPLRPARPRRGAGAGRDADAARPARHAVRLPGRGAGAAARRDPARPGRRRRRPRPRARPDPVGARPARRASRPASRGCRSSPAPTRSPWRRRRRTRARCSRSSAGSAALRRASPVLQLGAQRLLEAGPDVLAWERELDGEVLVAAVNFAAGPAALGLAPGELVSPPTRTAPTWPGATLAPGEAVLFRRAS